MYKIILFAFLVFGPAISFVGSCQELKTDSLTAFLKMHKDPDTIRVFVLNELINAYGCQDVGKAEVYFKTSLDLSVQLGYWRGKMDAFKNYGNVKYCSDELDSAIFYFKIAEKIGCSHGLNIEAARVLSSLGFFYQTSGNFDSSNFYFRKGLALAKMAEDKQAECSTLVGLGTNYQHRGEVDSALQCYYSALEVAEKAQHKSLIVTVKLNIATFYYDHQPAKLLSSDFLEMLRITREIGDKQREISVLEWLGYLKADSAEYEESLRYFEKGLEINSQVKDQNREILLLQGISYSYNLSGNHAKSIEINNKVIAKALSTGYEIYLPAMFANNVSNYIELNQYRKAIEDGFLAIKYGKKTKQKDLYYKVYEEMAKAYNAIGNYKKAYDAQLKFTELNNEIFDFEKSRQLTEMETKYATEKKESEIASLSQKATIQTLELQQKNQLILIGLIFVTFSSFGAYVFVRQRALKNREVRTEIEQRFLRSQLNPHFIFNALMAIQNFMLKNSAQEAALYLSKFSKLMREILENSREEFIPVESEVEMLTNYLEIHQLRLNQSFDFKIEIDDEIDVEVDTIPPMFVQPFVENAVEHGVISADGKGLIEIRFKKEKEHVAIEILDNGGGLQVAESGKDHQSLATSIIKERMALFNKSLKEKIQLTLEERRNDQNQVEGMRIQLKVPFSYV